MPGTAVAVMLMHIRPPIKLHSRPEMDKAFHPDGKAD